MAKAKKTSSVLTEDSFGFFRNYINTPSPVGFEFTGQRLWIDYIRPYVDEIFTDPYGTAVGVINPQAEFKVVIEAHVDEISWYVNYITNEGLIYLKRKKRSEQSCLKNTKYLREKLSPMLFGYCQRCL